MNCITGTTRSVARKLLMKSSRKLSEERSFPSTLMERGTSGRILIAAFRKASANAGNKTVIRRKKCGKTKKVEMINLKLMQKLLSP